MAIFSSNSRTKESSEIEVALFYNNLVVKTICFNSYSNIKVYIYFRFYEKFRIPAVVGCIDGTHIAIIRPNQNEERFYNRKGYHSRNVLIVS